MSGMLWLESRGREPHPGLSGKMYWYACGEPSRPSVLPVSVLARIPGYERGRLWLGFPAREVAMKAAAEAAWAAQQAGEL